MGLPWQAAIYHAAALRKMEHCLGTGFGISEEYLEWYIVNNPGGLGQGNGGGLLAFIALYSRWKKHMKAKQVMELNILILILHEFSSVANQVCG